jgi:tRNA A37 threonylcarbamoyladenosine modification protein TsaB
MATAGREEGAQRPLEYVPKKNSKNCLANASVFLLSQPASLKNVSALLCGAGPGGFFTGANATRRVTQEAAGTRSAD